MFFQSPPVLANTYAADRTLRAYLARVLPGEMREEIEPGLERLGERAAGEMMVLAGAAEASPPRHVPYDPWGKRIDRIEVSEAWKALDRIAAEEGIVATAYERAHGGLSRLHQAVLLYLYHPSSAVYSCPLAMTDGAARVIERFGKHDAKLRDAFAHLTTRDPDRFWTSGQWMTERTGGSDVSGTSTVAKQVGERDYELSGVKWFTSATTSQLAMTLARIEGDDTPGTAGLSLFCVELRDAAGTLRGIRVERLKDKLGTRALPTAELTLDRTPARLVGDVGNGVRRIATILNITRLYNAVCAVAAMQRAIALASDYATRRVAFGRPLAEQPLHVETLAAMAVEHAGALQLVFHVAALLGREECGMASEEELLLLRLLTPVAKLYTGKQAIAVTSEALEAFGGAGYIEDTGLPRLLRDAQVLSIWEGTTNVLSLDVLRAIGHGQALVVLREVVARRLDALDEPALVAQAERVRAAMERIERHAATARYRDEREAAARGLAFAIARTFAGALLLEQAQWALSHESDSRAMTLALRWCAQDLAPLAIPDEAHRAASGSLLF